MIPTSAVVQPSKPHFQNFVLFLWRQSDYDSGCERESSGRNGPECQTFSGRFDRQFANLTMFDRSFT
ncbi:hypothetical protein MFFC18_46210 [Mariniblastus fucicola]|uniref:Uncharacterized protein n=1 Tax=Mariniblastus fucicola TaxID=980251 RepID=A0A5B9PGG4_9BACT|nr:hypothetical protein MFFC18_46210 [Mariniblastus fucicola]